MTNNVYTDGACSGNPGIGGWGAVILIENKDPIQINGGQLNTTNNQMELKAVIEALKYFENSSSINLFTDSKYVKNGIQLWIQNWKINGWKTSAKKLVKNKDLWLELDEQLSKHKVNWYWVKGHSGDKFNEKADQLARKFIENN
tara:strand:- start:18646 stop:19077 length:432 start_codon:yes stop_codon:yes gene_type:complete